ncbi:MAG: TRAP transporter small permease [Treponema sp.]|jgi:TRAP-type C4-dicarboxylate transport system permease small subunit|nr:TRAP transporter small permease [Treponema sp.]
MKRKVFSFASVQNFLSSVIALILVAIMCVIFLQTFTRYVIFYSLPWSEELSRYLFVAMILLGINIGISNDMLVRIDLIDHIIPAKGKKILEITRNLVALAVSCIFFYSTFGMIRVGKYQKSPALQISMSWLYIILCAGFGLAVLSIVIKMVEGSKGEKSTSFTEGQN